MDAQYGLLYGAIQMYDDGCKNIVNTDVREARQPERVGCYTHTLRHVLQYSGILIEKMRQRHEHARPQMECAYRGNVVMKA